MEPSAPQQPLMFQMKVTFMAGTEESGLVYNLMLKAAILFACSCVLWYLRSKHCLSFVCLTTIYVKAVSLNVCADLYLSSGEDNLLQNKKGTK